MLLLPLDICSGKKNQVVLLGTKPKLSLTEVPWYLLMGTVLLYHFVVLSVGLSANEHENPILKLERHS